VQQPEKGPDRRRAEAAVQAEEAVVPPEPRSQPSHQVEPRWRVSVQAQLERTGSGAQVQGAAQAEAEAVEGEQL